MEPSLADVSYEFIRAKLANGDYSPGRRLVNRALAEQIGVSVIPVREAISRLVSEGLVEHVRGAGAYVRQVNRQELNNLYVLREALESCAAAEAAQHITEDQLDELDHILDRAKQTAKQICAQPKERSNRRQLDRWMDDEQQFHELLIEASRNPLLAKVVKDNRAIGSVFEIQRNDPRLLTGDVAKATCESKAELLAALRDRDAKRAKQLMSDQIQRGRRRFMDFLNQQGCKRS
ncbi:GntR family transcriptional regulator [Allorhodopirellula solitaria]|uniref:HTH-type transcriptional regulator McbR n=1 Tax=Allorhodopirellula solitaria TaxID=2527987 RepID=A0A5C5XUP8_9BACT|nr:GntR family transcriptional regulator [Allorhodopirellula solitaria]TWT65322.1 HTH-type transcriptional regulator McbR [Allorhodopirellula solitaria]